MRSRPWFYLTDHAEQRFHERAGPAAFDPLSRRAVPVEEITRSRLMSIANSEIARGERVYGKVRMHIATETVQRYGNFSAEDELVVFDDHGWMLRRTAIASFFDLSPDVLRLLGWPLESLRLIAHQRVCDEALGSRTLGDKVSDDEQLEDALRRAIRAGVRIPASAGVFRYAGPFEAERTVDGVVRYEPMTLVCELAAGTHGNVVRRLECRAGRFVREEHVIAPARPTEPEKELLTAPEEGLVFAVGGETYRVHLGGITKALARVRGPSALWEDSLVRAAPNARMLTAAGTERFFQGVSGKDDGQLVGFAFPVANPELLGQDARTLLLLADVGKRLTGQFFRHAFTQLSPPVLAHLKYV